MISDLHEVDRQLPNRSYTLRPHFSKTVVMETRMRKPDPSTLGMAWRGDNVRRDAGLKREQEYNQSFSQGDAKKAKRGSYFGLEAMLLLVCLTASLLILPLVLPPLPPPPYMLLLLPICIFGLLMVLAFMPSNVRDLTCTCM